MKKRREVDGARGDGNDEVLPKFLFKEHLAAFW